MLKASELRIGNLINVFGILDNVTPDILMRLYGIEKAKKIALDLSYAFLTQDIILRFGFHYRNKQSFIFKKYHNEKTPNCTYIELKEVGNNPTWIVTFFDKYAVKPYKIEIQYIHQLQNLYFCHVGEELVLQD